MQIVPQTLVFLAIVGTSLLMPACATTKTSPVPQPPAQAQSGLHSAQSIDTPSRDRVRSIAQEIADAGIQLRPEVTFEDLLEGKDEELITDATVLSVFIWLGRPIDREPHNQWASDDIYWFDWEDLEIDGMYVRLMEAIARLSEGTLQFENIDERMDFETEQLSISFSLNDTVYLYQGEQFSDWINPDFVSWLMQLPRNGSTEKDFIYIDTGDQTGLIAYGNQQTIDRLSTIYDRSVAWLR